MEPLAVVTRNDHVESLHHGYICVVNSKGEILYSRGDYETNIFFRSSAKPIQTIAVLKSGAADYYGFDLKEIALACSSHSGEGVHQQLVMDLIERLELKPQNLHCGIMEPYSLEEQKKLIKEKQEPTVFHCSCSGKHAAMLALAKFRNSEIEDYQQLEHKVQQEILSVIGEFTDIPKEKIILGTDGCGVPIYLLSIKNIALSYARLMAYANNNRHPYYEACNKIVTAMSQYPELVGGQGEFCTALMKEAKGKLIGKIGCEAVYCIGIKEKELGICIKISDGSERALFPVVMSLLSELKLLNKEELEALEAWHSPVLKNNLQQEIGKIVPVFHKGLKHKETIVGQHIGSLL